MTQPRLSDAAGLHLSAMCRRSVIARLRRYSMSVQPADLDDIAADATLAALECLQRGAGWQAQGIRSIVWRCARSSIIAWIEQRSTRPIAEPEQLQALQSAPADRPVEDLPAYVAQLAPGLVRDAFALSRANDDATAQEMIGCSERTLYRRKRALRDALAIMAPAGRSDR